LLRAAELVFELDADDGAVVFPERALELGGDLGEAGPDGGEVAPASRGL
jgi:hypothetical protein